MKILTILTGLLLVATGIQAQQIERYAVSSGGGKTSQAGLSATFTMGETAIVHLQGGELTLSQGFQQTISGLPVAVGSAKTDHNVFAVYPNPAQDYLHIAFKEKEILQVSIRDIGGKDIRIYLPGNSMEINITDLKPGFYIISIETKNQLYTAKFLKQ